MNNEAAAPRPAKAPSAFKDKVVVRGLNFYYGKSRALKEVNLSLHEGQVTAFIGPSGCGKSTLLRVLNRMYDLYPGPARRRGGAARRRERAVEGPRPQSPALARRHGVPEADAVSDDDLRQHRLRRPPLRKAAEIRDGRAASNRSLKRSALWNEVKDKLNASGLSLSGGQQQRLCIARTVAIAPEVILFDEPCSALDPISTAKIEELIDELSGEYTIAIVTHNMQQAARVSHYTAFMYLGEMIEFNETDAIFTSPRDKRTQDYVTGRFG